MPAGEQMFFFDNFQNGLPSWEPMAGNWDVSQSGSSTQYTAVRREYALSYAGNPNWSNYRVNAQVIIDDDRQGQVGIVGRGDSDHYYYELVLGRSPQGQKSWAIRQRQAHRWTTLATGAFDYDLGTPYVMRLAFQGLKLEGSISRDLGGSFDKLGTVEAPFGGWQVGRFGVVSYGGAARFDDLGVIGNPVTIALVDTANGWGPVSLLRDNTNTFPTGKPSGGWYVTPIHVTLRPDGKVLVTGFSRKAASGCTAARGHAARERHDLAAGSQRAGHQPGHVDPAHHPDQRAEPGSRPRRPVLRRPQPHGGWAGVLRRRHPLPGSGRAARLQPRARGPLLAASSTAPAWSAWPTTRGTYHYTQGGQYGSPIPIPGVGDGGTVRGEKWYPTTLLMPDGKMLIFGGFHWSSASGAGVKANNSFEMFDTAAWDANHNTYPYSVLTQHTTSGISGDLPPTRGYSNMFLLPKPVPAGSAGGFARSVAIYGGKGRVALFNHEPGAFSPDTDRLFAGTNALTISPEGSPANERAEGGSGVLLSDGRIMIFNGGHTGDGAKRAYVYNPYTDTWLSPTGATCTSASCSLDTIVSRMYGQAVQLPDGQVMIINGYGAQSGDGQAFEEMGNESDITGAVGDPRQPVLVDPYASPMTATPQAHLARGHPPRVPLGQPAAEGRSHPDRRRQGQDPRHRLREERAAHLHAALPAGQPHPPGHHEHQRGSEHPGRQRELHHQLHRHAEEHAGRGAGGAGLADPRLRHGPALRAPDRGLRRRRHRLGHREGAHQHQHRAAGLLQPVHHQQLRRALDGRQRPADPAGRPACTASTAATSTSRPRADRAATVRSPRSPTAAARAAPTWRTRTAAAATPPCPTRARCCGTT